jgi:hypothetical protein
LLPSDFLPVICFLKNFALSGRTDRLTHNPDLLCEQRVADNEAVAGHALALELQK